MQARWARVIPVLCLSLAATLGVANGQSLEAAGRGAATAKARYTALQRFGAAHPKDQEGAVALLALALADREERRSEQAIARLKEAQPRLDLLEDYVAYHLAAAQMELGNFAAAVEEIRAVWKTIPPSPLAADAALLAARAYKESGRPADAVRVLRDNYDSLGQPAGDLLLAESFRNANDPASAVNYFQRVYHEYPASGEAERAAVALKDLSGQLGELFRPPTPAMMLRRAQRLADAREYRSARAEYQSLASKLEGEERDIARVRAGVMTYNTYDDRAALSYLRSLDVGSPEADAERLYYMLECARRMELDGDIADAIDQLNAKHPSSPWRMRALISAGNHYLVRNEPERYGPIYRACSESFPEEARAAYCHWKITWNAYLNRQPGAREMLREHLVKFPGSVNSSAALYFLARLAEAGGNPAEAKAYYEHLLERYPNYYYTGLANRRLAEPVIFRTIADPAVQRFLDTIVWPVPARKAKFDPEPATQVRLNRARLLQAAGLDDEAERELRFSIRSEKQPEVVAVRLAQSTSKYDAPHRALQLVKRLMPGYLAVDYEDAPASFWRILYPLPWRGALERYARQRGLDPFTVAGLIRQESEFNPNALSPANAYGLTQVMPSTGRQLLKMSRRRFRPRILFNPDLNLRLGTTYLKDVLDSYAGRWEHALAAYNAGPTRVKNWMSWADYREPAEFIETIPFSETREYVMAVLRNAEMYRRIYESEPVEAARASSEPAPKKVVSKKSGSFKRQQVVKPKRTPARRRRR